MATYQELKAQAEAMAAQAEQARLAELDEVIAQVQKLVREYELTPEQVFGAELAAESNQANDEGAHKVPLAPQAAAASTALASTVKTALNPAAAWPFPTGSRP